MLNCSCQELWEQIWHQNAICIPRKGANDCSCSRNTSGRKWEKSEQQFLLKHLLAPTLTRVFYNLDDCKSDEDGCQRLVGCTYAC